MEKDCKINVTFYKLRILNIIQMKSYEQNPYFYFLIYYHKILDSLHYMFTNQSNKGGEVATLILVIKKGVY